jgi:hypothetical protein
VRLGGPPIDIPMLVPLLLMAARFSLLLLALLMLRMPPRSAGDRAVPAQSAVR